MSGSLISVSRLSGIYVYISGYLMYVFKMSGICVHEWQSDVCVQNVRDIAYLTFDAHYYFLYAHHQNWTVQNVGWRVSLLNVFIYLGSHGLTMAYSTKPSQFYYPFSSKFQHKPQ